MKFIRFLRIFVFVATPFFMMVACEKTPEKEKTVSGTVTANDEGIISFMYSTLNSSIPESCLFTTDLPEPNNEFTLTIVSGSTVKKDIEVLSSGQTVAWTAKVQGKPLDHGSGNFVHIVND